MPSSSQFTNDHNQTKILPSSLNKNGKSYFLIDNTEVYILRRLRNKFLELVLAALHDCFMGERNRPVLVSIVWIVKDTKTNLGSAGILTHDLHIRGWTLYHWTTLPTTFLALLAKGQRAIVCLLATYKINFLKTKSGIVMKLHRNYPCMVLF